MLSLRGACCGDGGGGGSELFAVLLVVVAVGRLVSADRVAIDANQGS